MAEWLKAPVFHPRRTRLWRAKLDSNFMAITYVLFSKSKDQFYVGSSRANDLEVRIKAHNGGKVRSRKTGRPWIEIAKELFESYTDARKREIFLKTGVGRKWLREHFGYLKQS